MEHSASVQQIQPVHAVAVAGTSVAGGGGGGGAACPSCHAAGQTGAFCSSCGTKMAVRHHEGGRGMSVCLKPPALAMNDVCLFGFAFIPFDFVRFARPTARRVARATTPAPAFASTAAPASPRLPSRTRSHRAVSWAFAVVGVCACVCACAHVPFLVLLTPPPLFTHLRLDAAV